MPTVKVKYDKDEFYPYYSPLPVDTRYPYGEIEIDEALYERWVEVLEEFKKLQDEISEVVHGESGA
jgi:hypothetical protein